MNEKNTHEINGSFCFWAGKEENRDREGGTKRSLIRFLMFFKKMI